MQDDCPISKQEVLNLIERLRQNYNRLKEESIPNYSQQEINEVYACLQRVYSGFYPKLEDKLCATLFNLNKGHYLSNGNKRVSVILTYYLYLTELYNMGKYKYMTTMPIKNHLEPLTLSVAAGNMSEEQLLQEITSLLK